MSDTLPSDGRHPLYRDELVSQVLPAPRQGDRFQEDERLFRDTVHFGLSLLSEIRGTIEAAPGYIGELLRNGIYPDRMTFRKLPYDPERSDLKELQRLNPEWVFREDFDPRRWVFVFLHGYVDNTGADRVAFKLASLGYQVYMVRYPFLRNVRRLAGELAETLERIAKRERGKRIVPIGHSLGGFIWDHLLLHQPEIVQQYEMPLYIPMGSPHFGTIVAYFGIGQSARQMRPRSDVVLAHLNRSFPAELEIYPFVSRFDTVVMPIETSLLKRGINYLFSEIGHVAQIIRPETVAAIEEIIASPPDLLRARATKRPFYPSSLLNVFRRMSRDTLRRIGVDGVIDYIGDPEDRPPQFWIRIVHHELRRGTLATLRHP